MNTIRDTRYNNYILVQYITSNTLKISMNILKFVTILKTTTTY